MSAKTTAIISFVFLLVGMFLIASQLVAVSLFLATGTLIGLSFLYSKLPLWLKKTLMWGPIRWILDVGLSLSVPMLMGFTLQGLMAGVIFGIEFSLVSMWEEQRLKSIKRFPKYETESTY